MDPKHGYSPDIEQDQWRAFPSRKQMMSLPDPLFCLKPSKDPLHDIWNEILTPGLIPNPAQSSPASLPTNSPGLCSRPSNTLAFPLYLRWYKPHLTSGSLHLGCSLCLEPSLRRRADIILLLLIIWVSPDNATPQWVFPDYPGSVWPPHPSSSPSLVLFSP